MVFCSATLSELFTDKPTAVLPIQAEMLNRGGLLALLTKSRPSSSVEICIG